MTGVIHNNRLTVLLGDQQETWHDQVERLLEPQGVQTIRARSGHDALAVLQSQPVHLAVLGMHLPQLGGLQVIRLMQETKPLPPTILLADRLTNGLLHEALQMHIFSVLTKPVDLDLLLDAMARVLRRFHESRWPEPGSH